ncbi:hypothetical protein Poli38472_000104 [Pythium oligandrum]|uniref:Elicitin-like protein n=1 Tax=Pythium oligandrum TaxID=41045 RepID=A0A8K1FHS6_PYTOL|nr:hypothetical protein Poli38472_000104 [Pythium oligandrum]|eukprot:TMW60062.1 hypothetical protein Poli38472_000104 [Pythium oligandrum]
MKPSTIICILALAGGSAVSAAECSKKQLKAIAQYDDKIVSACGSDYDGFFASSGSSIAVCKNPACVGVLDSVADEYPDCTLAGMNMANMYDAIARYCKTEGNSTDGSHSASTSVGKPECSDSDKTKVDNLRNDPAMTEICGDATAPKPKDPYAKYCSSECTAYIKEKFIPALPDCTVDGGDVEETNKIMLLYCDMPSAAAGALMSMSTVALSGITVAALAMI